MFVCFFVQQTTFAQQEYQFSQIHEFPLLLNPAYAGFEPDVNVNLIYRTQWLGLVGAPQSYAVTADLPIDYFNSGFGLIISNDEIGLSRLTKAALLYSYRYRINSSTQITAGVKAGAFQYEFDGDSIRTSEGIYEDDLVNHNDILISNVLTRNIQPNLGFGIYFAHPLIEVGLAANQLINFSFKDLSTAQVARYGAKPQFNLQLKTNFEVLDNITIKPALFLHSDFNVHQLNLSIPVEIGDLTASLGYRGYNNRSNDALIFMLGYQLMKNFTINYAYDLGLSSIKQNHSGSHEFALKYRFKNLLPAPENKIIYNPRFL